MPLTGKMDPVINPPVAEIKEPLLLRFVPDSPLQLERLLYPQTFFMGNPVVVCGLGETEHRFLDVLLCNIPFAVP